MANEPDFTRFTGLPENADNSQQRFRELMSDLSDKGATWMRLTVVSPEHPNPDHL